MVVLRLSRHRLQFTVGAVYSIPCSCNNIYIRATGRNILTRCKEHYVRQKQIAISALAENSHDFGLPILFDKTGIIQNPPVIFRALSERVCKQSDRRVPIAGTFASVILPRNRTANRNAQKNRARQRPRRPDAL